MDNLIYLHTGRYNETPLITSLSVANLSQLSHATILKHMRRNYISRKTMCFVTFSEQNGFSETSEFLTESEVTRIFQSLRRTDATMAAEAEISRQFYEVKSNLNARRQQREKCLAARQECIDLGRANGISEADDRNCLELVHRRAFGMGRQQYRNACKLFGNTKRTVDYMSAEDLHARTVAEERLAELLRMGKSSEQIRAAMLSDVIEDSSKECDTIGAHFDKTPKRKIRDILAELFRTVFDDCA